MSNENSVSRRTFVKNSATTAAAFAIGPMIVPRHVLGGVGYQAPSDTLNVAMVGIGGMGKENMIQLINAGANIVAICDCDWPYVERAMAGRLKPGKDQTELSAEQQRVKSSFEKAKRYTDFRKMLQEQKDIDAVSIATPDHMHAIIAYTAMKMGKHVYVQKPLTYTVQESRILARTARDMKVVSQMGNQGHSREGTRRLVEWINGGVIGPVRDVHVWTDRPQRYWAQGIPRPAALPVAPTPAVAAPGSPPPAPPSWNMRTVDRAVLAAMAANPQEIPARLDWDLFIGGAKFVPYHPAYHPFSWRGWVDFGVSAIGDMGAHLIDQPFWALNLGYPTSVVSTSTPWGGSAANPGTYPLAMTTRYQFGARESMPPVALTWYDGGLVPMIDGEFTLPRGDGGGGVFVGEKGFITYETYGDNPKVYPESAAQRAEQVARSVPRIEMSHEANWMNACKGNGTASSPFDYAAKLTETMLLGVAALRTGQANKILYDGSQMRITNNNDANQWLTREYRAGWQPWSSSEATAAASL